MANNNIVLCFDGTNNEYAAINTNVIKMYAMIDRSRDDQFMYYQPGIGTIPPPGVWDKVKKWVLTRLDLAFAFLLENHVCDGYRFLMRYYCPGDRIFIFGFSRGAYTARALAAMLYRVGLLSKGNEELVPFAWGMFQRPKDDPLPQGFKELFCRELRIHFLGVWDTVSSVGWAFDPKYLEFTAFNPSVDIVRHAVALDERRAYFRSNLWSSHPPPGQDVSEIWFPGVHCDVGGGYVEREAGLSKLALRWMVDEAKKFGLGIDPMKEHELLPLVNTVSAAAPSVTALKHESLRGLWWIVEWIPKRYRDPLDNFRERLIIPRGRHRTVPAAAHIDVSVDDRMKAIAEYRPPNLPVRSGVTPGVGI
jgi:uncharacterized protein (DUF2235 family)